MCGINNIDIFEGVSVESKIKIHFNSIRKEFGSWRIDKIQFSDLIGVSTRSVETMIAQKECPKYRKIGKGKNSKVVFFAIDVAEWMANTSVNGSLTVKYL